MGCFFIPTVLNGSYYSINKDHSEILGALECFCTLIFPFILAGSIKGEEDITKHNSKDNDEIEELAPKGPAQETPQVEVQERRKKVALEIDEPKTLPTTLPQKEQILEARPVKTKKVEEPKKTEEPKKIEEPKKVQEITNLEEHKHEEQNFEEHQHEKLEHKHAEKEHRHAEQEHKHEEHKYEEHQHEKHEDKHAKQEHKKEEDKSKVANLMAQAGEAVEKLNSISTELKGFADELKGQGVEQIQLVLAIDCTASNNFSGKFSFNRKPLHAISSTSLNFYEQVIGIMGSIVKEITQDPSFPVYIFGDRITQDRTVRPLYTRPDGSNDCSSLEHVLAEYRAVIPKIDLSGPTSFRPAIEMTIELAKATKQFHLLIIIGDGTVSDIEDNAKSIVEASNYPILIIMVGVGDGDTKLNPENPWEGMNQLDSEITESKFDNFAFLQYKKDMKSDELARTACKELAVAYEYCKKNGILE